MRCSTQILCAFCAPFPCSGRAGLGAEAECDKALCWEGSRALGRDRGHWMGLGCSGRVPVTAHQTQLQGFALRAALESNSSGCLVPALGMV